MQAHAYQLAVVTWVTLAPVRSALTAAMLLPLADLGLALAVAYRNQKPKTFRERLRIVRSSGLKRTVAKIALYLSGIVLGFATETYLGVPYAIRLVTGIVGVTELKSCLEHLDELHQAPLFDTILSKLAPDQPAVLPPEVEEPRNEVSPK
jgi:hypothetical protein